MADANDMIKGVNDAQGAVGGFASKLGTLGPAIGAAAGAAFVAVGTMALKAAQDVDDAMDNIRAATGKTGPALNELEQDFRAVWISGPEGAKEVGDAIAELNQRLGLTGPQLQAITRQILDLARITNSDLNAVIESSARLFTNWGLTVAQQGPALDMLFRGAQASGIEVLKLSDSLAAAGPTLRALGIDFANGAALIASFEKAGISGDVMLAGLRKSVVSFAKDNLPAQEALRTTIEHIKELGPGADATRAAMEVFGAKAGPQLAQAIAEGKLSVDAILAAISGGKDTIQKASDDTKGFSEQWKQAKNALDNALEPIGTLMLKALEAVMPALISVINILAKLVTGLIDLRNWATKTMEDLEKAVFHAVDVVYGQLVARFQSIVDAVKRNLGVITDAFKFMAEKVALHSYIPDMMNIVDVQLNSRFAQIALQAAEHATTITDSFQDMSTDVSEGAIMTADSIQDAFGPRLRAAADIFDVNIKGIPTSFADVQTKILGLAGDLIAGLKDFFGEKFGNIVTDFIKTWKQIENIVKKFVDAIDKILNFNPGAFGGPFGGVPGSGGPGSPGFPRRQALGVDPSQLMAPLTDQGPPHVEVLINFNAPIQTADPASFGQELSDSLIDAIDRGLGKLAQRRSWQQGGSASIT